MGKVDPNVDVRKFGLELVGNIAWGTHLCEFYETKRDLIDTLVPYFVEGLRSNEFCMWVTSPPLEVDEAKKALKKRVPDLDRYVEKGQIEIISYADWYLLGGEFDADRVLQGLVKKEKNVLKKGFEGLRLTGNTFWIERKDWANFADYEASVNAVIGSHRMIALCTYSLKKCGGTDVVDVMRNHVATLIRKGDAWNLVEDVARRKRAENGLQHEREFSELLVNSSVDGILAYDRDFRFTVWNEMMERISGLSREQVIGKSALEAFPILKQTGDDKFMREALAGKTGVARDLRYKMPDTGREGCFEAYYSPILSGSGGVLGGLGIVHDVTEQRKTEEALKVSEKKYRDLVANLAEGIWTIDKDGKITYVNSQMAKMLGYSEDEMIGRLLFDFMDERGRNEAKAAKWLRRQGTSGQIEQEFIKKDGSRLTTLATTSPVTEHGRSAGVIAGVIDITERKETEEHIRTLSAFPAENPNPIIRVSGDGKILYANSASLSLLAEWNCQVGQLMPREWCQRVSEAYNSTSKKEVEDKVVGKTFSFLIVPIKDAGYVNIYGRDITERKKAEETIRQSEQRMNRSQEMAHLGSWELDLLNNRLTWSDEVYRIFGLKPQEFASTYEAFLKAVHPEDRTLVDAAYSGSLRDGTNSYEIEHRVVRPSGEVRIVHEKCEHVRDSSGRIIRSVGMVHDVTERKKMEEAIQQAARDWEETFDSVPDLIAILDNQHKIVRANQAMAQQLSLTPEKCIGLPCYNSVHGTCQPPEFCPHAKTLRDGQEHIEEVHEDRLGGDFLVSTTPLKDEQGQIMGSVHVARNITERKKTENQLRETRDYLDSLLNYANAPIIVWDPEFRITMFNHAFERLSGLSSSEAVGKPLDALFPKEQKGEAMGHIQRTLTGEQWETVEIPIMHKDGTVRTLLWNSANIHDPNSKKVIATIAQGQDITERKSLEAKLEQYARHLEQLVDEKTKQLKDSERLATIGQTAGMVGHDIRNPLQSIEGAVYLAKEEVKSLPSQSPEQKELEEILHIIENQTRYIDHIVADLQDFARTPMPQPSDTDLGALVNDTLSTAKIPKNVQVQTALQENLKLLIDPTFLRRIMINLIDNAVQAMPNGGKLNVTLTSDQNNTSIRVEDTGIGISENDKPKIYTPLFTTKAKGQGFGLAVCKKLIEAQGGKISFASEAGKGTSFTVTFANKKTN